MITKEEFEEWRQQMADMNRWEREQPPDEHSPEWYLAAVGALYELLPESTRAEQPDPNRPGLLRMQELLSLLPRDDTH